MSETGAARLGAALMAALLSTSRPSSAAAGDGLNWPTVDVTSTTLAGWHTNDPTYGELYERLNLAAAFGAVYLGVRVDTATFVNPTSPAVDDRYTLEKASLAWSARSLEAALGDSYVSFGRGLALSLRKIDELGVDTTLRGAKVLAHGDVLGGTLVAGYANINNVDEASGTSLDDPLDVILGARAEVRGSGLLLGVHGSVFAFRDALGLVPTEHYRDRFLHAGATFDAPRLTDWLDVYAEGITQVRRTESEPDAAPAHGAYASATAYFGSVTIVTEAKAYGGLEPIKPRVTRPEFAAVTYNNPPTAERLLQLLENPQKDVLGGRVRADWRVSSPFLSYANYAIFRDVQGYSDPQSPGVVRPGTIHAPYVGMELRTLGGSWVTVSGGWRSVFLDGSGTIVRRDLHVDADGALPLGAEWNATLHVLHTERAKYESRILAHRFREGTLLVGLRRSGWGGVALGYDYTTDPAQPKRDYFNASADWSITSASNARVFVGGTRGGLRCASGVCRMFPPFEGIKLSATLRF